MRKKVILFLGIEVILVLILGVWFVSVQQKIRLSANDLPATIAATAKQNLEQGLVDRVTTGKIINLRTDNDPFVIILNQDKKIIGTTALLDNSLISPPVGVMDAATKKGVNKITWAPEKKIREAIIVIPYKDGYVIAGQSLKTFEDRIGKFQTVVGLILLVVTALNIIGFIVFGSRAKDNLPY